MNIVLEWDATMNLDRHHTKPDLCVPNKLSQRAEAR
jgi:hypothetical protein